MDYLILTSDGEPIRQRSPDVRDGAVPCAEDFLRTGEERFRVALTDTPLVVATCDRELRYTWIFNPQAPFTVEGALGRRDDELAPAGHVAELVTLKRDVLAGGARIRREVAIRVGDELRHFDITAAPFVGRDGEAIGVTTAASDITERKRADEDRARLLASEREARERAEAAIRAREAVLRVVAHDLRSPLSAIRMAADLIATTPDMDAATRLRRLDAMRHTTGQMERLLQGLLDFQRMDAGGALPMSAAPVALVPLLYEAVSLFELAARENRVEIVVEAPDHLPRIVADRGRILQVLWNLIGNALRVTPSDGRIVVAARAGEGVVHCSVRDTGAGIVPEHMPHLFESFWQADPAFGGAGLGLPIAKAIVEAHGGRITAESEVGAGSTFTFQIPTAHDGA